ncbi:MAG: hypothetical protein Q9184_006960 [Pyrenodesmia sp. 2 TL-2023]
MQLNGIHRQKIYSLPDLSSLPDQRSNDIFRVLCEADDCAEWIVAFLQDLKSLVQDAKTDRVGVSEALGIEKETFRKVVVAWRDHILVPIQHEASRRAAGRDLGPLGISWPSRSKNLGDKISDMNGRLATMFSHTAVGEPCQEMPAASPWEALLSCILVAHDPRDEGAVYNLVTNLKAVREQFEVKKRDRCGGQPRMSHLAIRRLDGVKSTTLGFSVPSWKFKKLKEWAKTSRLSCFSEKERTLFTKSRQKPLERLQQLRHVTNGKGEGEAELRSQAIKDLGSVDDSKAAVALRFPQRMIRNRCFVCFASTQWKMWNEEPAGKAMQREVESGWKVREGTELSCAEVETDIQLTR